MNYSGHNTILDYLEYEKIPSGKHNLATLTGTIDIYVHRMNGGVITDSIINSVQHDCMTVVIFEEDTVIDSEVTITNESVSYGLIVYCRGILTNNGKITMTGLGCNSINYSSVMTDVNNMTYRFSDKTIDGGSGGYDDYNGNHQVILPGDGNNGTCIFLGGSGGGGMGWNSSGSSDYYGANGCVGKCFGGGQGGKLCSDNIRDYTQASGSRVYSNPQNQEGYGGGTLIVFAKSIEGTGKFESRGADKRQFSYYSGGYDQMYVSDGGNGGGSITLCYCSKNFSGTIDTSGSSFSTGSCGGSGAISNINLSSDYFEDKANAFILWPEMKYLIKKLFDVINNKKQNKLKAGDGILIDEDTVSIDKNALLSNYIVLKDINISTTDFDDTNSYTLYHPAILDSDDCIVRITYDDETSDYLSLFEISYVQSDGQIVIQLNKKPENNIKISLIEIINKG